MKDNAISYVGRYVRSPQILSLDQMHDREIDALPEYWRNALALEGKHRCGVIADSWKMFAPQLALVHEFLHEFLLDVQLLRDESSTRLLYELEKDGRVMYYAGGIPGSGAMSSVVSDAWTKLPTEFHTFYNCLHNGWYYLASQSLGPSPAEDFFLLSELEWGILEDIEDPGCDLSSLLAVYTNGMGAYVAINFERTGGYGDVLWWKDREPRFNIDVWGVIDAWTEIGLNK